MGPAGPQGPQGNTGPVGPSIPTTDNVATLGNSTHRWGNFYVGGTINTSLGSGIVKSTSGVLGVATPADFPTLDQNTTGNAGTATALQTAHTINGTPFDGTSDITITADAGTLTGSTLNSTVTASSLTSVGTLSSLTVGTGGAVVTNILSGTGVLDFPSTNAGNTADLTLTVTGAADGDAVFLGVPNGSQVGGGMYMAWVSAANTVTVRFLSNAANSDPASGTFRVVVYHM
jgi:hypothetical protein